MSQRSPPSFQQASTIQRAVAPFRPPFRRQPHHAHHPSVSASSSRPITIAHEPTATADPLPSVSSSASTHQQHHPSVACQLHQRPSSSPFHQRGQLAAQPSHGQQHVPRSIMPTSITWAN
ncbi:hypothetical protein ACLOJK_012126 [Asimina triloba]